MAYTFKKRVGPTKYSSVSKLSFYKEPNPFDINSATGGNCTWWAWGRFREVYYGAVQKDLKWTAGAGNACSFVRIMKNAGYKTGLTPKPGAIICWGYNGASEGGDGHVAFVEKVNVARGEIISIEISQSGWSSGPLSNRTLSPGTGKRGTGAWKLGFNNSYFNGFIYNKVDFGNPAGTLKTTDGGETGDGTKHTREWYIKKYGNGARVYFLLKDEHKYTHRAACAILGNMEQESGIRTRTGGSFDGNGSEGLCQWTFGRKTKMQEWAAKHSSSGQWDSCDGQVSYLVHELKTSYPDVNKYLKDTSHSRDQMVEYFCDHFERPASWAANKKKRKEYAKKWHDRMSGSSAAPVEETTYVGYDMQKRSSTLYSSQNYEYLDISNNYHKESESELATSLSSYLKNTGFTSINKTGAIPESILTGSINETEVREPLNKVESKFEISNALVQAPFVEVEFGNYTIGSFKNSLDYYPNHITALNVKKINGEINQYTINLVHQIRYGEDPNLLDKVFSTVRYGKIKIRYGDCASGSLFKDTEAIITNISQNRDYSGKRISYTVYATSSCNYVTSMKFNFPAKVNRPSEVIRELLYNSGDISSALIEVFPAMANQADVEANGWLPTNDAVLNIDAQSNKSLLDYITFLVACMSNSSNKIEDTIRISTYFLTYEDKEEGSYFKIVEQGKITAANVSTSNVYNITIGYPDGNDILAFNIDNDNAWSLLYKNGYKPKEFYYDINSDGDITQTYSKSLFTASSIANEIQKNWWTQMVEYPITAQLVMRGLLKPISLMDYINIDVRFYGMQHITSGLYVITGQQDVLDGSGFKTNLSLLRVGDLATPYVVPERTQRITKQGGSFALDTNLMNVQYQERQRDEVNLDFVKNANNLIHAPRISSVITTPTPSNTSSSSTSTDSTTPTQSGLISYQFSGTGKSITLSGVKFSTDDKKVATVDKNGKVTSVGSGTCHILATRKDGSTRKVTIRVPQKVGRQKVIQPLHEAASYIQKLSWDAGYNWRNWSPKTIARSKYWGTCVTFPAVVYQKLGLIKSGTYVTGADDSGAYGGYTKSLNAFKNKKYFTSSYCKYNGKSISDLIKEGKIQPGDAISKYNHTFIYAGVRDGTYRWHEAGHSGSGIQGSGPGSNRAALWHKQSYGPITCQAYFHVNDFNIKTSCKNGTITGTRPWLAGQNVKITYKAASGCKLKSITVDGKSMSIKKHSNYYTFKNIDDTHTIHVEFENPNGK